MTILPTADLDLISPFPPQECFRIWGWAHCHTTEPFVPAERVDIELPPEDRTWGLIDRDGALGMNREFPLVGLVCVSPDGWLTLACTRKAFRNGMAEQALRAVVRTVGPVQIRLGRSNIPMLRLLRNMGFHRTGKASADVIVMKQGALSAKENN